MSTTVGDLVSHLESVFPTAWGEPWDRLGLLVGDAASPVERVFVSLDVTAESLGAAIEAGAQALVTHHPVFLDPPARLVSSPGSPGLVYEAARRGIALIAAHTNLDRSPKGGDCLAHVLGLEVIAPLERGAACAVSLVTYAPEAAVPAVLRAAEAAGGGAVGRYSGCSFTSVGTGRFTPLEGSRPAVGTSGAPQEVPEVRVEIITAREQADAVMAAVRSSHPYEEPVITVMEAVLSRGSARLGRLCVAPTASTLGSLAAQVAQRLHVAPRVWGDAETEMRRVALAQGSGRSMVQDAIAAGAQAMITGELGYHDALEATARGLCVIEAGHDATEWPLVPYLASVVAGADGLEASCVIEDRSGTRWWTTKGS